VYLLSCLLPGLLLTNDLFFSPPLEDIHAHASPIHLRLFKKVPLILPPREVFSKHSPIGTGRPRSSLLLAESDPQCPTPEIARASLAFNILRNNPFPAYMLDRYNVLATLYTSSTDTLRSLYRGMIEMLGVPDAEWCERLQQMAGVVDGACVLEARMEVFLLGMGRCETEDWVGILEFVMEMEERDRGVCGEVYRDAAGFLGRAVWDVWCA
jgi:hypothetical protein